jgi:hypothetical protein
MSLFVGLFIRFCEHSAYCSPELLKQANQIKIATEILEEVFENAEFKMDRNRKFLMTVVVAIGLVLAFSISALETFTGTAMIGPVVGDLIRLIVLTEELLLHIGLVTIIGMDYVIILSIQYLYKLGKFLLVLVTLLMVSLGHQAATTLVTRIEQRMGVAAHDGWGFAQIFDYFPIVFRANADVVG